MNHTDADVSSSKNPYARPAPLTNRSAHSSAFNGSKGQPPAHSAQPMTLKPSSTLGAHDQSTLRQLTRNCLLMGFSKKKSRSPVRTRSANSLQFSMNSVSI